MLRVIGIGRFGVNHRCITKWHMHRLLPVEGYCQKRTIFSTFNDINYSIASSSPVQYLVTNLISLHEWLHIPWFVEIAFVTFLVRTLVAFPLTINQRKIIHRYESLKPEITAISKHLKTKTFKQAYFAGINKKRATVIYHKQLSKEIKRLIERDNCHPIKAGLVPFFQIPVWITLSHSYRNLSRVFPDPNDISVINANEQLKHEGFLWFHDLTLPDPVGALPIMTALVNLTIIQMVINERRRNNIEDSIFSKIIFNGGRLFSLVIIPIGLMMPSSMSFYWLLSSSLGLAQNAILMNDKFKKFIQIDKINVNTNIIKDGTSSNKI